MIGPADGWAHNAGPLVRFGAVPPLPFAVRTIGGVHSCTNASAVDGGTAPS